MNSTEKVFKDCREAHLSHCRKLVFAFLSLAIILLAVYSNSFDCSWQFDDEPNITDNPNLHLQEITWQTISQTLFSDQSNPRFPYRPVACFTFALNYYFGELDVFGYHLVNLVIHWLSAIFLFLFIYHTLNLPKLKAKYAEQAYSLALLATFIWAVNPVQVQAVTYIVQRMASMAGMFFILSMYLYLKARTSSSRERSLLFFGLCFISFIMALGSKQNAAMLPVVILVYEALLIQENSFVFFRKNLTLMIAIFGCTLFLGIGYLYFKGGDVFSFLKSYETTRPFTLGERLLTQPRVVLFYMSLLLYPLTSRLNLAHSFELSRSLFEPISTFFSILAIVSLIALAFSLARKRPLLSFCILFFFLNHLIESSIFPLEIVYEHRNYIPSMLFFLPFALGLLALIERYEAKIVMKYTLAAFIALLLIGFGHATYLRNFDWKTPEALWSDTIQKSPEISRAYNNLGRFYHDAGHFNKALQLYEEALQRPIASRNDEYFFIYFNLGKVWVELRDYTQAEFFLKQAIHMNPLFGPAYNHLAGVYDKQGKYDLAYQYLLKSFKQFPHDPIINLNLGCYYLRERRFEQAIQHLRQGLYAKQFRTKAVLHLAIAHNQMNRLGKAAVLFQEVITEQPQDIRSYLHLAEVYWKAGHEIRAMGEAEKAVGLIPGKDVFQKILNDILAIDQTGNLQPDGKIVIPLLHQAVVRKGIALQEWNELLKEAN